jgi:hypothetical protein
MRTSPRSTPSGSLKTIDGSGTSSTARTLSPDSRGKPSCVKRAAISFWSQMAKPKDAAGAAAVLRVCDIGTRAREQHIALLASVHLSHLNAKKSPDLRERRVRPMVFRSSHKSREAVALATSMAMAVNESVPVSAITREGPSETSGPLRATRACNPDHVAERPAARLRARPPMPAAGPNWPGPPSGMATGRGPDGGVYGTLPAG